MVFAASALTLAVATSIFAQETSTQSTGTTEPSACSYSYSNWSACQPEGKRFRSVIVVSPSGCVQTSAPDIQESCNYEAPQCGYQYSGWNACQSNGKQTRSLVSKAPVGCAEYTKPVLEQNCVYFGTTTTATTTTQSSGTACSYSYGSWSACQPEGKRFRSVTGVSPSGCVQTLEPKTQESCSYESTTTSTTSSTSGTSPLLDQCRYTYSDWSTCQSNSQRSRTLIKRSPELCAEYTKPVLLQSCVYDPAITTESSSSTTSTTSTTTTGPAPLAGPIDGQITPTFSFSEVTDGATWSSTVRIRGKVSGAQAVEYYLVPKGSNTYKYIGSGQPSSDDTWTLNFRTLEFPNGEYYLRAKIKNQYGEYGGGQRKIQIVNRTTSSGANESTAQSETVAEAEVVDEKQQEFMKRLTQEIASKDTQFQAVEATGGEQKKQIFSYCELNPANCFPERDSDNDGLSDVDELRFGTDPQGADSDWDGFIDGDEVKNGFDPVKYSPGDQSDKVVFESPKSAGETKPHYKVNDVVLKSDDTTGQSALQLAGSGLPNSFVTIYIFSEPIVLTVKTDSQGNWTYELDKELGDGQHEVYVAVTDNTGKITGKSEPLSFVKTAQAVTVVSAANASAVPVTSATEGRTERDILFLIAIIIGAVAVALALLGLAKHHHAQQKEQPHLS